MNPSRMLNLTLLSVVVVGLVLGGFAFIFTGIVDAVGSPSLKDMEKSLFGGIVVNKTAHDIYVTDWRFPMLVPPGRSSRDVGIYDVDGIIISDRTLVNDRVYKSGLFKFCDVATIDVVTKDGMDYFKPSFLYKFCRISHETGVYMRVEDAFGRNERR